MHRALEDRRIVRQRFIALAKIGMKMPVLACDFTSEISCSATTRIPYLLPFDSDHDIVTSNHGG